MEQFQVALTHGDDRSTRVPYALELIAGTTDSVRYRSRAIKPNRDITFHDLARDDAAQAQLQWQTVSDAGSLIAAP